MKDKKNIFKPFKGTVDDLLNHVNENIDPQDVENIVVNETDDVLLTDEEGIQLVKEELNCDDEEAKRIYNEIKREEVTHVINKLTNEGIIEITKYETANDGNMEPLYGLTEKGKQYVEQIKKDFPNLM